MDLKFGENVPPETVEKVVAEYARVQKWQWIFACVLVVSVTSCLIATAPHEPVACAPQPTQEE